jgi:hypothetical protein
LRKAVGFNDPDVVALRIQRLERVILALHKLVVKCSYKMEKDIHLAEDLNAMSMDLQGEVAMSPPDDDPF